MRKSLTLAIAVYNGVRELEFILAALSRQTFSDFEVIVADDGSGPEIGALVAAAGRTASFPARHIWQPDDGFRKNAILNKAIEAAQTDYMVFIDGDCVPHRRFLEDHNGNREPARVLCGRRVNLGEGISARLRVDDIREGSLEKYSLRLLMDGLRGKSINLEDSIRIGLPGIRRILHRDKARILGCNFSVEKSSLERINGFNEEYRSPGLGEDSDVAFRLELVGARLKTLRYLAVLYHLYHPRTAVGEENRRIFQRVVATREVVCPSGLRKNAAGLPHANSNMRSDE